MTVNPTFPLGPTPTRPRTTHSELAHSVVIFFLFVRDICLFRTKTYRVYVKFMCTLTYLSPPRGVRFCHVVLFVSRNLYNEISHLYDPRC